MGSVALAKSDRTLIFVTSAVLIGAGLFFAAVLLVSPDTGSPSSSQSCPLYNGPQRDMRTTLDEGSPLYFANPFGGRGFWLDREEGSLVALDVGKPGEVTCSVKWRGRVDSYVDCHGDRLTKADLGRYELTVIEGGERRGSVFVDLSEVLAPPEAAIGSSP
jgi:hypothetical protein